MVKLSKFRLSPATIIALLALFVALGGVGVAATGGNLILGQSNSATAQTALTANTSTATFAVTNSSTGSPLKLTGSTSKPPLIVNSQTKVAGLNADRLDGTDSSAFARGNKVQFLSARVTTPIDPNLTYVPIITVPGFGTLKGQCPNFNGVYDGFFHTSSSGWADFYQRYKGTEPTYYAGGGTFTQLQDGYPGGGHITFVLLQGSGASAATATIDLYTNWDATNGCLFQAKVMLQGG